MSSWGRRRPFIAYGAMTLIISFSCLAWTKDLSILLLSGNTEPISQSIIDTLTPALAIVLTVLVFVTVQPVQSGVRALIVDACPAAQQPEANAWASRLSSVASILGYTSALLNSSPSSSISGGDFKLLSIVVSLCLGISVALTCCFVNDEPARSQS